MIEQGRLQQARVGRSGSLAIVDAGGDIVTNGVVLAIVIAAGLNLKLPGQLPVALLLIGGTLPMWWRPVTRFQFVSALFILSAAAIGAGFYLAAAAAPDRAVNRLIQQQSVFQLLGGIAVMVAVLWGRTRFPLHVVAVAYGSGDLLNALVSSSRSWKYFLALPTTIIVVGWLGRYRNHAPAVLALLVLGVLTALDRGRSFFAFCVLAGSVSVWQVVFSAAPGRTRRWAVALVMTLAALALYNLAVVLLTSGYLGTAAQQRTVEQIDTSGSLLLGGRPTWTSWWALVEERPSGYGLGVVPNADDYAVVRSAFDSLNLPENDGYIRRYVLGGTFRLHSIAADLWVRFGLIGLALASTMALALGRSTLTLLARRTCPPLVALMTILGMWYLAFEPTFSYGNDLFFALGVALLPRSAHWRHESDGAEG